ncbi:MAG: phospholipid carrier-dependent glycosyltransferase, partial [Cyanobacteriota bacterium]|nr:phospholipid carrier-dependent glycosyltransferase [Cyanobacteriota bacterium]
GRLAMLDGPLLCFALLTLLCALRCRRDLRWGWGVGLGLSLLALTGGLSVWAIGAIAVLFWLWDTPRLLRSGYVALGLLLGGLPAIAWLAVLGWHARGDFGSLWQQMVVAGALTTSLDDVGGAMVASLPWLPFCLWGLASARNHHSWGWAKLVWVWSGFYLAIVLPLSFFIAISPMPLYPALALAGGAALAEARSFPSYRPYPRFWSLALMGMAMGVMGLCLFLGWGRAAEAGLIRLFACIALTLSVVAVLVQRQDRQFVIMLFWGLYLSLLLGVSSPYWIWNLGLM